LVISYDKMSGVVLSSVTVCLSEEDAAPFLTYSSSLLQRSRSKITMSEQSGNITNVATTG